MGITFEDAFTVPSNDSPHSYQQLFFFCRNNDFGEGRLDETSVIPCESDEVGDRTAICRDDGVGFGVWENQQDVCVLSVLQILLDRTSTLAVSDLPVFLDDLNNTVNNVSSEVVESPANIHTIVRILTLVANTSRLTVINETLMTDILGTVNVVVDDESRNAWDILNTNFPPINRANLVLDLPGPLLDPENFLTTIIFDSLDNVLPATNASDVTLTINGNVVLARTDSAVNNVTFIFDVANTTLGNPQCVFWNFSLLDNRGAWDSTGCTVVRSGDQTVTCNCNHLTSFSILMSPIDLDLPILDFITYIGVSISMASLVICLIIEAMVWRKIRRNSTSYLRHVCIVNIAVSLLMANIWFIISAAISDSVSVNPPSCSAATFFIHFFYLSMFFWMLMSALLLLYRAIWVFGGMSDGSMLAVGFSMGYGAPVIIAVVTVAVTAPSGTYFRPTGICWLNWEESKALLAFVIPALAIVVINLLILLVIFYKILCSRSMDTSERSVLLVIARNLAILTPFFGTTWGLGVGIMINPRNVGIHVTFALFNSLQGFFILVFGTLLDQKSTSAGNTSSSGLAFLRNWGRRGRGYTLSSGAATSTPGGTESHTNT
ncbi:hypothetical protein NHX12_025718 [Muraenolepis orangiensis]|uniref:Uncharacterized protein n=1 Tax=Muraenolepis orangiensis TaxID=630683 RepID=A0A9Q0EKN0_9TELE|nr:hypothetical protein NHX12_025718 [Muraenolepis orangiensis]